MLEFKPASVNDIPVIRLLAQQTWPSAYGNIISPEQIAYMLDLMYSEEKLQEQMNSGQQLFSIAMYHGEPVGFASIGPTNEEGTTWHLHKLYVLPSMQGKHVGRELLNFAIHNRLPKTCTLLELNVNRENPAVNFYKRAGFTVSREVDLDIGNGFWMNDYIMSLPITPGDATP